ncbi:unnamed protein product [Lymnaea stagnalis]|uniref:Strictosidine synthase conserved region domain-containing protein n=1 Tax=Lymnaea stagnalis TaxID=6523 RepID=A0AAV2IKI6_LYMST
MLLPLPVLLVSVFVCVNTIKINPVLFEFGGTPPNLTGPLEKNYALTHAERFKSNELKGPESFVYYKGHVYTGLSDGRVVDISDCGVKTVVTMASPKCTGEAQCGRPLGLRMDSRGRLIIADSAKGIFRVNVTTGQMETLYSSDVPINGKRCKFINDVVVARDGTILFTDSSAKWTRKEFLYVILEGEATGRLLAYSDKSNKTIVVLDNLAFPNGLEFGPQDEFLLISETGRARIRKLNLKPGKSWLQLTTFADNLPGLPDNIRASGRNTFWVAMSQARHTNMTSMVDEYASQPQMREMVATLSTMEQILQMSEKYGMVIELDTSGKIIRTLQDPTGQKVAAVSEAMERDGYLYLGSFDQPYVSRVALSDKFEVDGFLAKLRSTCRARKMNLEKVRKVLKRIVAIAEFRKSLINARKRQEQEVLAGQARASETKTASTFSTTTTGPVSGSSPQPAMSQQPRNDSFEATTQATANVRQGNATVPRADVAQGNTTAPGNETAANSGAGSPSNVTTQATVAVTSASNIATEPSTAARSETATTTPAETATVTTTAAVVTRAPAETTTSAQSDGEVITNPPTTQSWQTTVPGTG